MNDILNKKADEDAWYAELLRINERIRFSGSLLASIAYCGGTAIGFALEQPIAQVPLIYWGWIFFPLFSIVLFLWMHSVGKIHIYVVNYAILLSMSLSASVLASFMHTPDSYRSAIFSFFPIFITFGLVTLWEWQYIFWGALMSMLISACAFWLFYPNPMLSIWLKNWLLIAPVAAGMVFLMNFRYNTLRTNFLITRALNRTNEELERKNEDILASITYAQRIQQAILPAHAEIDKYIPDFFLFFRPLDVVSGDFYFFTPTEKGFIAMVADCTGHGVPGAFMSMIGNEILHEVINQRKITAPNEILAELHITIRQSLKQAETDNRDGMDAVLLHVDTSTRKLAFAGAKNSLYIVQNGELITLKGSKATIGGEQREAIRTFEQHIFDFSEPTTLYLTTDGYLDQFGGEARKKFGVAKFKALLPKICDLPAKVQEETLAAEFYNWLQAGDERQIDDVLIWGMKL